MCRASIKSFIGRLRLKEKHRGRITTLEIAASVLFVAAALAMAPMASADSFTFNLSSNNLGISGSVGMVTIGDNGTNSALVTITMNPAYSVKLDGKDTIAFNGSLSGLTLSGAGTISTDFGSGSGFDKLMLGQKIATGTGPDVPFAF